MNTPSSRFWAAMALYALGVLLRGGMLGWGWTIFTVLLVLNEVRPAWYRPPRWLRRPELGVLSALVFSLGALTVQQWDLDAWVWLAATALFVWDVSKRGEFSAAPTMWQEARTTMQGVAQTPADAAAGEAGVVAARVHKRAKLGLAICFVSLFFTWAPVHFSGFLSFERTGTVYVDGAGRTVDDRTWMSPRWNDTSSPSSNGFALPQGPWLTLTILGAAAVVFSRRYESPRLRDLTFKAAGAMLVLCTYANGYAMDALGWWVYVVGVGLFGWAAWEHLTAARREVVAQA